jgi:hypothetical protein
MSIPTVHLNDVGVAIKLTFVDENGNVIDISSATTKEILLQPSGGTTQTHTASFFTDGRDGIISYTISTGDLSVATKWNAQGYVVMPSGSFHTAYLAFEVDPNLA